MSVGVGETPEERVWKRIGLGWKVFGAILIIAGAPATFAGLWALFHHPSITPAVEQALVDENPRLNNTLAKFLARHPEFAGDRTFTASQQKVEGDVFTIEFRAIGLKGKPVVLRWFPIAAVSNRQPLAWPRWAPRSQTIEPETNDFPVRREIWAATPDGAGVFIERFVVAGPDGTLKDFDGPRLGYFNP